MVVSGGGVFSRTEPTHKQAIVRILSKLGEIAAMTGDVELARALLDGALHFLKRTQLETERDDLQERLVAPDTPESERTDLLQRFKAIQEDLLILTSNAGALAPSH